MGSVRDLLTQVKAMPSSSLSGNILNGSRIASAVMLAAAYPAAVVTALLAGETVFTRFFFGAPAGFLRFNPGTVTKVILILHRRGIRPVAGISYCHNVCT